MFHNYNLTAKNKLIYTPLFNIANLFSAGWTLTPFDDPIKFTLYICILQTPIIMLTSVIIIIVCNFLGSGKGERYV